jgi:hypothetical protein
MLITKHKKAIRVKWECEEAYNDLSSGLDKEWIEKLGSERDLAERERGDSLKIYQVSLEHGGSWLLEFGYMLISHSTKYI